MRVSVIGCGYLGAVHAASMAAVGHKVVAVDTNPLKVAVLARAEASFYEPGLPELLEEAHATDRLSFAPTWPRSRMRTCISSASPRRSDPTRMPLTSGSSTTPSLKLLGSPEPAVWWSASPLSRWGPPPGSPRSWP